MPNDTENATKVFDLTINITTDADTCAITPSHDWMYKFVRTNCKHWIYARQCGEITQEGHWQCRMTYKRPTRLKKLIKDLGEMLGKENIHVEVTEGTKQKDWRTPEYYAYIENVSTLVEGERIYSDKDIGIEEKYAGEFTYYPWQQQIIDMPATDRQVIVIHDPTGGTGKSELARRLRYDSEAVYMPSTHDAKDMIRAITNLHKDGKLRDTVIIDVPRAVSTNKMREIIIGIESVKNGIISEDRYRFDQTEIPNCKVILMCNNLPNPNWLTVDRWRAYHITAKEQGELKEINIFEAYKQQREREQLEALEERRIKTGFKGKEKAKQHELTSSD